MRLALFTNKEKHELHLVQQAQAGDERALHDLLDLHTPFIKKTASFICKRKIDEHDEEYSTAYEAFYEAIRNYDASASAKLTTFAHLIIKRRLIDQIRKEARMSGVVNGEAADIELAQYAVERHSEQELIKQRQYEILHFQMALDPYELNFEELTKVAPKHEDSRRGMVEVATIVAGIPEFVEHLAKKRTLPLKQIEELVDVSRKTLERHRKYIIALVILLSGDYPLITQLIKGGKPK